MCVRFSKFAGVTCTIAGTVFGLLALLSDGVSFVSAMTPGACLGFGVAGLTRTYLIINESAVGVKALIGPAQERYDLGATDTIEFDGARVFLVNGSGRRRLRGVTGWLADRHDWADFRAWAVRRRGAPAGRDA